jgi:glycosyltransferase involved in cell wall biosynthesis
MRPKILILGDYPHEGEIASGGIMRSVNSTVNALARASPEYDYYVITLSDKVSHTTEIRDGNLVVRYVKFPLRNKPVLFPKIISKRIILNEIERIGPDIVHANGTSWEYGYPAVSYNGCPVIVTVHGISRHESKYWRGLKGAWHRMNCVFMEGRILDAAENIVSVSSYVKREIVDHTRLSYSEIEVISNPVESKFFDIVKCDRFPNQLLFVGGIEERKGLEVLIKALYDVKKQIPDISLHIIGEVRSPSYYTMIEFMIHDLELWKNIRFLGKVSESQLIAEYGIATALVLPSYEESEGIVILEAIASGTPVIATRSGGAESVIQHGKNGYLCDCGDYEELARWIQIVMVLRSVRDRAIIEKHSAEQYRPENIARKYLDIYRRLL